MRRRRYIDPPNDERCQATIVYRDKSLARCGRRKSPGNPLYCFQHVTPAMPSTVSPWPEGDRYIGQPCRVPGLEPSFVVRAAYLSGGFVPSLHLETVDGRSEAVFRFADTSLASDA